jgi:phage N-6-adenine-methyltransferase
MEARGVISAVHFSSESDAWRTPPALFARLHARWHFSLDPCATAENATCPRYFTRANNGLLQPWTGRCFLNPPYGCEIGRWVEKAAAEVRLHNAELVVALLPARTDTRWWRDWVAPWARVRFLTGRLHFSGSKHAAPFPSAIAVYPRNAKPARSQLPLFGAGGGR